MTEIVSKKYEEIKIGDKASMSKKVTDEVVRAFADVSSDFNPIHVDDDFAKGAMFGERIAHGMLGASLISAVIGTKLPGVDTIYMGQSLKFTAPVFLDDEITATVEVKKKNDEKHIIILETIVTNQDGKEVIVGEATVMKK